MIRFTLVARLNDGLPLVATMESQREEGLIAKHKRMSKGLLKLMSPEYAGRDTLPLKGTVTADEFSFHYTIESGIVYLTLCDKSYPRLLAFSYLNEVSRAFADEFTNGSHNAPIGSVQRPYSFIRFEPVIQSTKKRYMNTRQLRTQEDLVELSSRIQSIDIYRAQDVLGKEYLAATSSPFASLSSLNNVATVAADVARALTTELADGAGSPQAQSRRSSVLVGMSLLIFAIDVFYLIFWWTSLEASDNKIKDISTGRRSDPNGFEQLLFLLLGLSSPILLLQAYKFNRTTHLPPFLADLTSFHASLTFLQSLWALICRNNMPPPGSLPIVQTGLQAAAAWFAKWCLPMPIVLVKLLYVAIIGVAVG
ncbi:SNAP receptor, partial [Borealophlyctis nickersoniae]